MLGNFRPDGGKAAAFQKREKILSVRRTRQLTLARRVDAADLRQGPDDREPGHVGAAATGVRLFAALVLEKKESTAVLGSNPAFRPLHEKAMPRKKY